MLVILLVAAIIAALLGETTPGRLTYTGLRRDPRPVSVRERVDRAPARAAHYAARPLDVRVLARAMALEDAARVTPAP